MSHTSKVNSSECLLIEFPNEKNLNEKEKFAVGFKQWLLPEDKENIQDRIDNKTIIKIYWPSNHTVSEASSMNKKLNKIVWVKYAARIVSLGGNNYYTKKKILARIH